MCLLIVYSYVLVLKSSFLTVAFLLQVEPVQMPFKHAKLDTKDTYIPN